MATYKSETVGLMYPAERVFTKLSNLEGLGQMIKNVPEGQVPAEQLSMLEQVKVTPDSIEFPSPAGSITLRLVETIDPTLIRMEGAGTPVPMEMALHIMPLTPDTCEAYVQIDLQIPAMLKPMVSGPLQKLVKQFADMLRRLPMD